MLVLHVFFYVPLLIHFFENAEIVTSYFMIENES